MPSIGTLGWAYVSGSVVAHVGGSDQRVAFHSGSTTISGSSNFKYDYSNNNLITTGSVFANIFTNPATMNTSITVPANHNSVLVGPITIGSGIDFIIAVTANAKII